MKIVILIFCLMMMLSCSFHDELQVNTVYVKLVKKEWHYYYPNDQVIQYWQQLDGRGLCYMEYLPAHDTGYAIGKIAIALLRR